MGPEWPHGKGPEWPHAYKTKNTSKNTEGAFAKASRTKKPLFAYPKTEERMREILEENGIDPHQSHAASFFHDMKRDGWKIRGDRVHDWISVYESRAEVTGTHLNR